MLVAGGIVAATNPAANAGEAGARQSDADLSGQYLAAVRRDLGWDEGETRTRLATEGRAASVARQLSDKLGDAYGGSWIDESGAIMVAVTDEAQAGAVRDAGAKPAVVRYGAAELSQAKAALDTRRAPASVHRWFVDPVSNSVVVEVQEGATGSSWVRSARAASPAVRVVEKTRAPQARANVFGGGKFNAIGPGFCSIGFAATEDDGGKAFLTAGHCATDEPDDVVTNDNGVRLGTFDSGTDVLGDDGDFAKVDVDEGDDLFGAVDLFDGTAQPIRGSDEVGVGAQICRSGAASGPDFGAQCGIVTEQDVTVNVDFGALGLIGVGGQTGTDICSTGGDSGGSFFTGDQAQGLLSSGIGECGDGSDDFVSHFTPVNTALNALDLELVTF